jgi:hypothetical protein
MIPQERELEGLSVIPIFLSPFLSNGGDRLCELLGEGQEVLVFPTRLLKPTSGLMGGSTDDLCTVFPFTHSFFPHTLSYTHSHALPGPFIDPSSPASWLERKKETELLKN